MNIQNNFLKIGIFYDSFQANMAKEILQSNGISCILTGDEFKLFDISSTDCNPIQLVINCNDQKKAKELLDVFFSSKPDGYSPER